MKVDRVILQERKSLGRVLEALDHNLTARDNFGPEGVPEGWVLTSRGEERTPTWQEPTIDLSDLNVYTKPEVDALIAGHTHPASAIVSGILSTPRLGTGTADDGKYLRGDSTWQPLSLAGLRIAGEVANFAAAPRWDEPEEQWPLLIAGPKGADGVIGRDGAAGPPGMDAEPIDDWPVMIPGNTGPQGPAGVGGGTTNNIRQELVIEEGPDDWGYISGPGLSSLGGTGTPNFLAKFSSGGLRDALIEENPSGTFKFYYSSGNLAATISRGTITLQPQDAIQEGGEVGFIGAAAFDSWTLDTFQGRMRLHSGGTEYFNWQKGSFNIGGGGTKAHVNASQNVTNIAMGYVGVADNYQIRYNDDMTGVQLDVTKPSWAVPIGEGATDTISFYRKPPGGAYVSFWVMDNVGTWKPGQDNTRDFGTAALRLRDEYIAGELVGMNGVNGATADQATFTVLTDITNLSFAVLTGEVWFFEFYVNFQATVGTGGMSVTVSAPAASTMLAGILGSNTSTTTIRHDILTAINTASAALYGAGAPVNTSLFIRVHGQITAGANGTVQLRGTPGASTTIQIRRGSNVWARRKS